MVRWSNLFAGCPGTLADTFQVEITGDILSLDQSARFSMLDPSSPLSWRLTPGNAFEEEDGSLLWLVQ